LDNSLRAAPKRADLYWQAAAFLAGNDKPAEALLLLDQAERDLPGEREIPLAKAVALELSGQTAAAGDLLKEVQGRWPEWPAGWVARGIVLETHGGFEEARQALETAVSLGARSPETYYYLADSTLRSTPKRIDAAEKAAGQASALGRNDPTLLAKSYPPPPPVGWRFAAGQERLSCRTANAVRVGYRPPAVDPFAGTRSFLVRRERVTGLRRG
jgi:tetratricopeptide (TPR) repeat protein